MSDAPHCPRHQKPMTRADRSIWWSCLHLGCNHRVAEPSLAEDAYDHHCADRYTHTEADALKHAKANAEPRNPFEGLMGDTYDPAVEEH